MESNVIYKKGNSHLQLEPPGSGPLEGVGSCLGLFNDSVEA